MTSAQQQQLTNAATPNTDSKPKPHPSLAKSISNQKTDSTKSSSNNAGNRNNKHNQGPTPEQIARAKEKREKALRQIRQEKRVMLIAAVAALIATPIWGVAIATRHWYTYQGFIKGGFGGVKRLIF